MVTEPPNNLPDLEQAEKTLSNYDADQAIDQVLDERNYQRRRWSTEHDIAHTPQDWASIMAIWTGKVSMTVPPYQIGPAQTFKKRVTQLAAICLAALEATPSD